MTLLVSLADRLRNAGEYSFARKAEETRQLRARAPLCVSETQLEESLRRVEIFWSEWEQA